MAARGVYTVAPGVPFAEALARHMLAAAGGDALSLADATVLLPTRRAVRALSEAFLRISEGRPLLLPRMAPLGDIDEDEIGLIDGPDAFGGGVAGLPPAIPELRRRLLLAKLILHRDRQETDGGKMTPAQAAGLAAELARLIDRVQTEGLSFDNLAQLAEEQFAAHWQITLKFLEIVTETWPEVLAEKDWLDPADRRVRLLEAQAGAWQRDPPETPVIAAGSTGSVPATAALMQVILGLPQGAVVLPGLDVGLAPEVRDMLPPSHPQFGMMQLLAQLDVDPAEVRDLPGAGAMACPPERARLLKTALRPADDTAPIAPFDPETALAGIGRIDAPTAREEAGAVALALREALEIDGRTAALVTPDRGLARRVAAELRRWDIEIDDSAGIALSLTPPGAFLRLVAEMVAEAAAPIPLLAALKHPLAAGGMEVGAFRRQIRAIELAVLRGPRPKPGFDGLIDILRESDETVALVPAVERLREITAPFAAAIADPAVSGETLVRLHVACAEALAATDAEQGAERLWASEAGEAAALFVDSLAEAAGEIETFGGESYPGLLDALMREQMVRPRYGRHPRLHIWGPLEARLQQADLVVLAGLNEGVWPPEPEVTPWMSRGMMQDFGLSPPERRIGLAAHDFVQAASSAEIVLSRAERQEGTPTVPSRFLALIDNLTQPADGAPARPAGPWTGWLEALDRPAAIVSAARPAPRPPVAARPSKLSVTQIETWMRDPYAIYALHILGLKALEDIDADPSAAERGTLVHDVFDAFFRAHPHDLPPDLLDALIETGRHLFDERLDRPGLAAFWWPRFRRAAAWFADWETDRRPAIRTVWTETKGTVTLPGPTGDFTVTAKADRIDLLSDGEVAIIDYKTGGLPSSRDVERGFSPQLVLEAMIAADGGFEGAPASAVNDLIYLQLGGGRTPGDSRSYGKKAAALVAEAYDGLTRLIEAFADPATPYLPRPDPAHAPRYSDYEHLARVKEWSTQEPDGEG